MSESKRIDKTAGQNPAGLENTKNSAKHEAAFESGTWVGRKQAFAELAGRCSAATAECLRQARDRKSYRALHITWEEFCRERMGISRVTAEKIIQRLEEFGPAYFILAQASGITPEQYRRISSAVQDQKLLHAGEEIPITPENAPRLAVAVEELRRGANGVPATATDTAAGMSPAQARLHAEIEREFQRASRGAKLAVAQFKRLAGRRLSGPPRSRLVSELGCVISKLKELEQASWSK